MYLTLLTVLACTLPDAMPDALPDAATTSAQAVGDWLPSTDGNQYLHDQFGGWWRYETATGRIDSIGRDRPKAMDKEAAPKPTPKPEPAKKGHWENRQQCGPNGCQIVPAWVPDAEPAAPLPVPSADDTQQDAQTQDLWTPRRSLRRW